MSHHSHQSIRKTDNWNIMEALRLSGPPAPAEPQDKPTGGWISLTWTTFLPTSPLPCPPARSQWAVSSISPTSTCSWTTVLEPQWSAATPSVVSPGWPAARARRRRRRRTLSLGLITGGSTPATCPPGPWTPPWSRSWPASLAWTTFSSLGTSRPTMCGFSPRLTTSTAFRWWRLLSGKILLLHLSPVTRSTYSLTGCRHSPQSDFYLDLNMSLLLGSSRHISNISYLNYITSLMISNL